MLIRTKKTFFLSVSLTALSALSIAGAGASDSTFGLPATATNPSQEESSTGVSVIGLPGSNQAEAERTGAFLYVTYNTARMVNSTVANAEYTSDFGTSNYSYPAVDFFNRLTYLGRDFSLWGRYSLGLADRTATLGDSSTAIDSSIEKSSLLMLSARVGALLNYDRLNWIKPYAGIELDPYLFRLSADLSGADEQGGDFTYGPVIGFHAPILFKGTASIMAEYRLAIASHGNGQLFGNSNNFTAGMGLTF